MAEIADPKDWEAARLIPVSGIKGSDEQERRGASALLAVLESVHEFNRALLGPLGALSGKIECFIEVPFDLGDRQFRPDGVIRTSRGKQTWTALVEVKTDRNDLIPSQIDAYLDIARDQGYQAVITISNQIATTGDEHPCAVDKKKLRKVNLHHLSWSQIHTEAVIERVNRSVADPDQAWILSELIRYLEHTRSGAVDFDDMGPSWVAVRDGATNGTLRPNDPHTLEVAARFGQLIAFSGMRLSRKLGVEVRPLLTKAQLADGPKRLQNAAATLIEHGQLKGVLKIPNAIAPIEVLVDLKSGRATCTVTVDAPAAGRPTTRINWLLRQLGEAPGSLIVEAFPAWSRTGICQPLSAASGSPQLLFEDPKKEIRSFALRLSSPVGTKRGQGRGSFVGSILALIEAFYVDIVQNLKPWAPPAPTVRSPSTGQGESDEDLIMGELPVRPNRKDREQPLGGDPDPVIHNTGEEGSVIASDMPAISQAAPWTSAPALGRMAFAETESID